MESATSILTTKRTLPCLARARPNSAGGRREGPGFFARQPRARMTEQAIEQDRNCHYDLHSSIGSVPVGAASSVLASLANPEPLVESEPGRLCHHKCRSPERQMPRKLRTSQPC